MEFDSARPIWLQLVDEFARRIAVGEWSSGRRIPSVRELAVDLGVNPNTVQRSLAELDRLGLTASDRTSGRFVVARHDAISAARDERAAAATDALITELKGLDIGRDEASRLLAERWNLQKGAADGGH